MFFTKERKQLRERIDMLEHMSNVQDSLIKDYKELVDLQDSKISDLERKNSVLRAGLNHMFSDNELKDLSKLVHPDKHGGSKKASEMFILIQGMLNKK
jgi:uncharacterized coiled-coil protein SlyX